MGWNMDENQEIMVCESIFKACKKLGDNIIESSQLLGEDTND
jgi:hypothetical protein